MKLLLDTHVLLWSWLEPKRLHVNAARALEDPSNELWFSPISAWEILILVEKGRVVPGCGEESAPKWLCRLLDETPVRELPLDLETAVRSRAIPLAHQDPADRFLAAAAEAHDFVLLTADARLLACPSIRRMSCETGETWEAF